MTRAAVLLALLATIVSGAAAQTVSSSPPPGSVAGVVKDATTGAPLTEATVSTAVAGKQNTARTASQGQYVLRNLPPGQYSVVVREPNYQAGSRLVTVAPGQELTAVDFQLMGRATISGRVVDENKEPLPDISVSFLERVYYLGEARYVFSGSSSTDDEGRYTRSNLDPGRAYLLLAGKWRRQIDALSEIPLDPKRRRAVPAPTYYPASASIEGAVPVVLRPGEQRTGVDIRMPRVPAWCVEGVTTAGGAPSPMGFEIEDGAFVMGGVANGGYFGFATSGISGPDGKIRICELHPGDYRLTIRAVLDPVTQVPPYFGTTPFTIRDQDIRNFRPAALPPLAPVSGEIVWADPDPNQPTDLKMSVSVQGVTRPRFIGEGGEANVRPVPVPGSFSFANLFPDNYILRASVTAPGIYVKDITYGGASILNVPFRPGTAPGESGIRIAVARDGGTLTAQVADPDGKPAPAINVYVMPGDARSAGEMSARLISGTADQNGLFRASVPLPPGKYLVLASITNVTMAAESVAVLWRNRSKATEVEIGTNANAQTVLQPVALGER